MKKYSLPALILISTIFGGCSSPKVVIERETASKEFQCRFEEVVNGEKAQFVFSPDKLKLLISSSKMGEEVLMLEEDNFISGGFTYVAAKDKKLSDWSIKKIEFISFAERPSVMVDFSRTPASKAQVIAKNCSL